MTEGLETELKFELDPAAIGRLEQTLAMRSRAKTAAPAQTLQSTYYDTPGRELRKAGFSLRVRLAGGKRVQTVKSEAKGVASRGEWEIALEHPGLDLKAAGRTPMRAVLDDLRGELEPVFTTTVARTKRMIRQGTARVEAAIDQGSIEAEGRTLPICELELELKAGPPQALFDLARRLGDGAPLRLSFETKSQRGYRLLDAESSGAALKGEAVRLRPDMSAREAFQAIAASAMRQWVGNAAVLRGARRPEALHQLRVALRRLRTALKLFETVVADAPYAKLSTELAWLTGELDQGRDIDVLIDETFRPAAVRFHGQAGLAALGERLLKARTRAYDRILATLDGPRYLNLVLDVAAWIDTGPWSQSDDPLHASRADAPVADLAAGALDRLRRQIKRRGEHLKRLDPKSRHRLRIRAKRLRYAIEFFGGLHGRREEERAAFLDILRALQDSLGALNDLNVAREKGLALAEGGGRAAGETETQGAQQAFAAGLMIGARASSEKPLLAEAAKHYERLIEAKRFWR